MFEVLMNGVGDAFSLIHWGTHFLVRKGDFVLAVDCPDSFRRALRANGFVNGEGEPLDVGDIDAMILTHLHGDHVNGLEMTACYQRFYGDRLLKLYTHEEVAAQLWPTRIQASLGVLWDGEVFHEQRLEDFMEVEVLPWGEPVTIGPFTVETRPTKHHLVATAMRISDGEATLGYSCDTAYDPALIAWLEPCDLIIHESSLGPAHTPLERLVALPEAVREKLLVAHYPDAIAEATGLGVTLAVEGSVYEVAAR